MGFSLGACLRAVNRPTSTNQPPTLDSTLAYLLEEQKSSVSSYDAFDLGDLALLCNTQEELRLFRGTSSHLIQLDELHPHVQALVTNKKFLKHSNIRRLSDDLLPLVIKYALPPNWREATLVAWDADGATAVPSMQWFQDLWRYLLARLHDFTPLQDQFPLIPCQEGVNCRLSSRIPLLLLPPSSTTTTVSSSQALSPTLLEGLRRIGVLTVHDGLHVSGELAGHELSSFLRQPNRAGLLIILQLAQATSGEPNNFVKAMADELKSEAKDDLLKVMLREPVIELSKDHLTYLRTLPIFQVYGSSGDSDGTSSPPMFVAINSQSLFFLDIGPEKLQSYIPLMTESFIRLRDPLLEAPLLRVLGVPAVSRVDFLMDHVFPRLPQLDAQVRDRIMLELVLLDLPNLAQMSPRIIQVLKGLPFLPRAAMGTESSQSHLPLARCEDLYDPDVEELTRLIGPELFPGAEFTSPEVLALLRQLGLRSTLHFPDVVRIAQSVEECFARDAAEGLSRARNLFAFLNVNSERFFCPPKPPSSNTDNRRGGGRNGGLTFLSKALSIFDDSGRVAERQRQARAEEQERLRTAMVANLMKIRWVPALTTPPPSLHFLPWNDGEGEGLRTIACPGKARLAEDQWYCSSVYGIVDADFVAEPVKRSFGWKRCVGWIPSIVNGHILM